jgi:hypothetical protein
MASVRVTTNLQAALEFADDGSPVQCSSTSEAQDQPGNGLLTLHGSRAVHAM